ncbi:hypothetical protein AR689_16005 [Arthrobacter sp. EpRS71]|nr:hypothetical protein AR689_16005 [Arthrobacter sp. EpRS71]
MSAVLLVHIVGVMIIAVAAVVLMTSSFAVALAVRGVRATWAQLRTRVVEAKPMPDDSVLVAFQLPQPPSDDLAQEIEGKWGAVA